MPGSLAHVCVIMVPYEVNPAESAVTRERGSWRILGSGASKEFLQLPL